jgi:hypothetical protein
MWTLSVVPQKPVNERGIECMDVITKESPTVPSKFFPQRPVKPFDMRVHLGSTRIGVVMSQSEIFRRTREMEREFTPVVRLYGIGRIRYHRKCFLEEVGRGSTSMIGVTAREGDTGFGIDGGQDVAFDAVNVPNDCIYLKYSVSGRFS